MLINTIIALVGLRVAWMERERSEEKMWLMIAASIALTGPEYLAGFLAMIPGEPLIGLGIFLAMLAFVLRMPAYGELVYGVFDVLKQRRKEESEIRVPTVTPYGQSAYDAKPENAPAAPEDNGQNGGSG